MIKIIRKFPQIFTKGQLTLIKELAVDIRNVMEHEAHATLRNYRKDPYATCSSDAGLIIALSYGSDKNVSVAELAKKADIPEIIWWLSDKNHRDKNLRVEVLDELCLVIDIKQATKIAKRYPELELPRTRIRVAKQQLESKLSTNTINKPKNRL